MRLRRGTEQMRLAQTRRELQAERDRSLDAAFVRVARARLADIDFAEWQRLARLIVNGELE